MLNKVFVLTFVGVCLCGLTLAANNTVSPTSTSKSSSSATNTTKLSTTTTNANKPSSSTTKNITSQSTTSTRPLSSTTVNVTKSASNYTTGFSNTTGSYWNNVTHSSPRPTSPSNHHSESREDSDEKLDHNVEKHVIQVLKLFEKILMRHHNKPGSSEEVSGEHGPHHGHENHEQALLNNTYCSFGFTLYTEFRKALDSQNISQIAQRLGANVTNSTELQKSGFAGLIELISRQHPELYPFYEQCPGQVNTILANWAGSKTNNSGLNFTGVAPFPCTAHAGRNAITYNWNNNTRSLQWTLANPVNGSSNSSNQFNNQTSSSQNSTLPTSGSVSLQFIFDGIDYGYNKIYSEPVITNFATKYWVTGCPNWYNDLVEIVKFSLVREAPQGGDVHRQKLNAETSSSEESTSSSEEQNQGRRGYGRRGYGI